MQDPGYKLDEDTEHLAYPCGRFSGAIFWSDHADKVVEINQSCNKLPGINGDCASTDAVFSLKAGGVKLFRRIFFVSNERAK